jgi:hypothetical protein
VNLKDLEKDKIKKEAKMVNVRKYFLPIKTLSLLSFEFNLMYKSPFIDVMMTD